MEFSFVYVVIVVLMCFLAIDMRTHGMLLGIRAWSLGVSAPQLRAIDFVQRMNFPMPVPLGSHEQRIGPQAGSTVAAA